VCKRKSLLHAASGNRIAMVSCSRGICGNQSMFLLLLQERSILPKGREGLKYLKLNRVIPKWESF